jgi:hypothetical protein
MMLEAAKSRLPELVENGDIESVTAAIREKYGFTPSPEYVRDLIVFVGEMVLSHAD